MTKTKTKTSYFFPVFGIFALSALFFTLLPKRYTPDPSITEIWKPARSFQFPRRAPAAIAHRGYIYLVGGVDSEGSYVQTVEFSKIDPEGHLSPWQNTSALQQGRFYLAATAVGDFVFAIGGGAGPLGAANYPVATVERARILENGSLSPWETVTPLGTPRRGLKVASDKSGRVFAIGGYDGKFLRSIEHSQIFADGEMAQWQTDPEQSLLDRYIHSAAVYKEFLYVLGGHVQKQNSMSYGDVEMSRIRADGFVTPWQIQKSRLNHPRFIASAFAAANHLYIAGGHNGAQRLDSVEFALIAASGQIGQWRMTAALRQPRSAAAIAHNDQFVFILGGMSNDSLLNTVEYTHIHANGQLGFIEKTTAK
ncbi:MAG: hypothetical protein OEZ68_11125 [Gammaproteobacteria bacterium]|nr:hypothetical protein [Gammaproteobacteria bacterium]MDH5801344.1 hypothetical protein [Gammaproteobacteria bacterium]